MKAPEESVYMEFDIGIIGIGAAGSHLLHALLDDPFFRNKSILVVEKEAKDTNDRTWSFWELASGRWDELVHHRWDRGRFISGSVEEEFALGPYAYKTVRALDFYEYTRDRIGGAGNVEVRKAEVKSVGMVEEKPVILLENGEQLFVSYLFDSRIDKRFYQSGDNYFRVWQHFKGWIIRTKEDVFDPDQFVMMDFRIKHGNETSFTYILPFSPRQALVEFTFFSPGLKDEQVYDTEIKRYLKEVIEIGEYEIEETESGIIPMTNYPFHRSNRENHIRIGTAGSWVKPSSGYSFKNAEKKARKAVANIKENKPLARGLINQRHRFYDSIFLDLLYRRNDLGEELFSSMYSKNDVQSIFRFLDEETTLKEELAIIGSFRPAPFLEALGRHIARQFFAIK